MLTVLQTKTNKYRNNKPGYTSSMVQLMIKANQYIHQKSNTKDYGQQFLDLSFA